MSEKSRKRRIVERVPTGFYIHPRLHVTCPDELEVENCKGILLCDKNTIRLDLGRQEAVIHGDGLRILSAQKRLLRIHGRILSVEFSFREEVTV